MYSLYFLDKIAAAKKTKGNLQKKQVGMDWLTCTNLVFKKIVYIYQMYDEIEAHYAKCGSS